MDDPILLPSDLNSGERRRSSRVRSTSLRLSETPERSTRSTPVPSVKDTPQAETQSPKEESPVPSRSLRRRKSAVSNGIISDPVEEAMKALTEEERQNWKGWVELESDPVSICDSCLSRMKFPGIQGLIANIRLFSVTFYEHMASEMSRFRRSLDSMTIHYSSFCMHPPGWVNLATTDHF